MTDQIKRPVALILLDGWAADSVSNAHTPYYDEICQKYPMTTLSPGGNVETGHMRIAAGRAIITESTRINSAIASGTFFEIEVLREAFSDAGRSGGAVHFAGLLSGGERHASSEVLYALLKMAKDHSVKDLFIHGFLDGRDVPPQTAEICIEALEKQIAKIGIGRIASLCGRFFAMDKEGNWERTARAFTLLVHGEGEHAPDAKTAIERSAMRGISEEFLAPIVTGEAAVVRGGDTLVFFNHRADGMRQLTRSIASVGSQIHGVCMTEYDKELGLPVVFPPNEKENDLSDVLASANLSHIRILQAEGSFNGEDSTSFALSGQNIVFRNRDGVSSVDAPEMSSFKISNELIERLDEKKGDFFVVNLPALDVVGSGGNAQASAEAIQYIDTCLGGIVDKVLEVGGTAIITSPGSSSDIKSLENTATFIQKKLPFHLIENGGSVKLSEEGTLSDIAPTILGIFGLAKPPEMSGNDLRSSR